MSEYILLPDKWQDWRITNIIGSGSYGTVYKAERTVRDKVFFCAVKVISVPRDESETQMLRREYQTEVSLKEYYKDLVDGCIEEIQMMDSLKGISNIVSIEDYAVVRQKTGIGWDIFIRMEYLQSFPDYMVSNKIGEREAIKLGTDICTALSYCEKLDIIHRDIKPDNIFISPLGDFKLGDFGLARKLDRSAGSYSSKGTMSFMAPEVNKGLHYGKQADIYSLGLVLYRILNRNKDPFVNPYKAMVYYRDKDESLRRRMDGEKLPPPVDGSEEIKNVVLKACAFEARDRYQSAGEMKEALLSALKKGENQPGEDVMEETPETSSLLVHKATPSKRSVWKLVAVVALAGIICLIAFYLWKSIERKAKAETSKNILGKDDQTELLTEKGITYIDSGSQETDKMTEPLSEMHMIVFESETQTEPLTEMVMMSADIASPETDSGAVFLSEIHTEGGIELDTELQSEIIPDDKSGDLGYESQDRTAVDITSCTFFTFEDTKEGGRVVKYLNKKELLKILKGVLDAESAQRLCDSIQAADLMISPSGVIKDGTQVTMTYDHNENTKRYEEEYLVKIISGTKTKIYQKKQGRTE